MNVAHVLRALDTLAPPHLALDDDPRGLLVGDPAAPVSHVAVALDATLAVAESAAALGAQLVVAHHPLVYHPLKTVRRDDPVGAVVLACARNAVAVACAHTNWDVAPGGINDVLAERLGVHDPRPLRVTHREPLVKIAVFVPPGHRDAVLDAMAAAGAGAIGDYDRCGFFAAGQGTFRPLPGARPFQGEIGRIETTPEERLEMVVSEALGPAVVAAMKRAHPYEEVAYDVFPLRNTATEHGIGRVGALAEGRGRGDLSRPRRRRARVPGLTSRVPDAGRKPAHPDRGRVRRRRRVPDERRPRGRRGRLRDLGRPPPRVRRGRRARPAPRRRRARGHGSAGHEDAGPEARGRPGARADRRHVSPPGRGTRPGVSPAPLPANPGGDASGAGERGASIRYRRTTAEETAAMAYEVKSKKSGQTYYLHSRPSNNGKTKLFFFAREVKEGAMDALPEGYTIGENERTGLPVLKKK
jgi:putative NIF3 family GTP cyclohydrolase 1 type 2